MIKRERKLFESYKAPTYQFIQLFFKEKYTKKMLKYNDDLLSKKNT